LIYRRFSTKNAWFFGNLRSATAIGNNYKVEQVTFYQNRYKRVYSSTSDERVLLVDIAAGNPAVMDRIYKQHFPTVCKWIAKNGGSMDDGADIFQEAILVLFEKVQVPDFTLTCSVGTYLFAIGKNLWFKKLQQRSKEPFTLLDNTVSDGDDEGFNFLDDINHHHEKELNYAQLAAALSKLGEPCKSLLEAYYHQDKNMIEIAAAFGYTNAENAKNQKYKCLTRLKKLFFNTGEL
jgi:RNA polymerase sigma factor (sigma-70 family)